MTGSPALDFLLAAVAVGLLNLMVMLLVDRVERYRRGVGLAILEDRPGTDEQFAEWRSQLAADREGDR